MQKNRSKGFTLIELLVVIAIIGILSAVVLASLNTALSKGQDAAIQSDLSTIQTEAEIYYGGGGSNPSTNTYAALCTTDPVVLKALAGISSADGGTAATCNSSATLYAVAAPLNAAPNVAWCTDSAGDARNKTAAGVLYSAVSGSAGAALTTATATVCN